MGNCVALAKSTGEICGQPTLTNSEFCLFHDPAAAELRERGRRAGGAKAKLRLPEGAPITLSDIRSNLSLLAAQLQVHEGSTTTVNALLKTYDLLIRLAELEELEGRIADLEASRA